ncbi:hypothetical protein SKAU_G00049460 [Synaphobranchus kaupii]|uniref:Serotransferrin n=1 Tax=Synaphobranchus kaupii TaxID=118154 RepID=A0A9Q1G352_SYNKA|nr:hypothetical protein SKAU_G00049460 [Synaphobranchus kaupii]
MAVWTLSCVLLVLQTLSCASGIRWCTISDKEMNKCNAMAKAFSTAGISTGLQCVSDSSVIGCARKLTSNQADAFSLSAKNVYTIGKESTFKVAAGESNADGDGTTYYAVAVVKKNDSTININNLKGKKSCHTGKGRTAGWNMPLGYLIDSGRMSVMGCNIPQGVADFFLASCIPGAQSDPASLCQLCIGDEAGANKCSATVSERYYSYAGAFRCMAKGVGDVAFVKHTTVMENTDGNNQEVWAAGLLSAHYELLCRDGTRAPVAQYKTCNLVRVPARGIVVRSQVDSSVVYNMLREGLQTSGFAMFSSAQYGGQDLMFSDNSKMFLEAGSEEYKSWMGLSYYNALRAMDCTPDTPEFLRWCVLSDGEQKKCVDMADAFLQKKLTPKIQCVFGKSVEQCMQKIQNKEADAITLDGGFIYTAGKSYGLVPASGESYTGDSDGSVYYAVAVLKKNNVNIHNFNELKGTTSCHTGYGKTAGWNIPMAVLMEKGLIRPQECQVPQAAGEFFQDSCVPGANQHGFPSSLCSLCIGDSNSKNKCVRDMDRYDGYNGAFRCMVEGSGQVAFVKHTTVKQNSDGNSQEPWAINLQSKDFQLLCPHGARAEVTEYANCNLARVPSHAVMVRPDTNAHAIFGLLDKAQVFYGSDPGSGFRMFDSSKYGGADLIFKDSTMKMIGVADKKTYEEWLGQSYIESLQVMECRSSATALSSVSLALVFLLSSLLTLLCI